MASMVMQCMTASRVRSSLFMVLGLVGGIKRALARRTPRLVKCRNKPNVGNKNKSLCGSQVSPLAFSPTQKQPILGLRLFLNSRSNFLK